MGQPVNNHQADDWRLSAACRLADARLFDLPEGEERRLFGAVSEQHTTALEMCAGCPVRDRCLSEALTHHDSGVRGGVVLDSGKVIGRRPAKPAEWVELLGWHAEMFRCRAAGETPSAACVAGERAYQAEAYRRRQATRKAA